jgi:outer membrane lipoprotein-sorting protein
MFKLRTVGASRAMGRGLWAVGQKRSSGAVRAAERDSGPLTAHHSPLTSRPFAFLLSLAALTLSSFAHADEAVQALLKTADHFRLAETAAQVETEIVLAKNGVEEKNRRYSVFTREGRKSVVVMRSPSEKGQKVLMLGDEFWLIMPSSQRPIRITPMQKLLGEASTGDVASMTWAGDYDGTIAGDEACDESDKRQCVHLSLHAQRKGLTYARIELWVAKTNSEPVRAELYVASDKLAKRASFKIEKVDGRPQVSEMTLTDELQAGRTTRIHYLSRVFKAAPDEWYNPMFLTRAEIGSSL